MSDTLYYVISAVLSLGVLLGIRLMSNVKTAPLGNRISALACRHHRHHGAHRFLRQIALHIAAPLVGTLLSVYGRPSK